MILYIIHIKTCIKHDNKSNSISHGIIVFTIILHNIYTSSLSFEKSCRIPALCVKALSPFDHFPQTQMILFLYVNSPAT